MAKKPEGWRNKRPDDPERHAAAARGVKSNLRVGRTTSRRMMLKPDILDLYKTKLTAHKWDSRENPYALHEALILEAVLGLTDKESSHISAGIGKKMRDEIANLSLGTVSALNFPIKQHSGVRDRDKAIQALRRIEESPDAPLVQDLELVIRSLKDIPSAEKGGWKDVDRGRKYIWELLGPRPPKVLR